MPEKAHSRPKPAVQVEVVVLLTPLKLAGPPPAIEIEGLVVAIQAPPALA